MRLSNRIFIHSSNIIESAGRRIHLWSLLLIFSLTGSGLEAQYSISNNGFYDPQYDFPQDITIGVDELSSELDIGFTFTFFGNDYSSFYLSSNGFITFDPSAGSGYFGQYIPDSSDPNNLIAMAWGSLEPDYVGAYYETMGTAPNRSLHVNFYAGRDNYNEGFGPGDCDNGYYLDGQIILYETTNIIEIHTYSWDGADCLIESTQGIENEDGSVGYSANNYVLWSAYEDFIAFIPDSYVDIRVVSFEETSCEGLQDIEVLIQNVGGSTIDSLYFGWEWDNTLQDTIFLDTPIAPNDYVQVTLGQKTIAPNTNYELKAWSFNPDNGIDQNMSNDTISGSIRAGMSGTYTIGGTSPDFATISDAIDTLHLNGICDSAVFEIRNGTYTEELDFGIINTIPGGYAVFQSESGMAEDVIISETYNSYDLNRLVELNNTSNIHFRHLTLQVLGTACSNAFYATSYCSNISISECILLGSPCTSTTVNGAVIFMTNGTKNNIQVRDNIIRKGSSGIYVNPGYFSDAINFELTNNTIDSFYRWGAYLDKLLGMQAFGNAIFSPTSEAIGLEANSVFGPISIENHQIYLPEGRHGMRIYGFNEYQPGSPDTMYIINNMINLAGSVYGSSALQVVESNNVTIWHNTINNSSLEVNSFGFYSEYNTGIDLRNCVVTNLGTGMAAWLSALTSDHNVFYNVEPPLVSNGTDYDNLSDWIMATGQDGNSLQVDPYYESATDLHVGQGALNNAGDTLTPFVAYDFDLEDRHPTSPDIGADEFGFLDDDLTTSQILFSNGLAVGENEIQAVVYNIGQNEVDSFTIELLVNDSVYMPVQVTTTIPVGGGDTIAIGTVIMEPGISMMFRANTILPNGHSDNDMANDTASVGPVYALLNGLYTVGGDDPDFPSLSQAFYALSFGGIIDSVEFAVRDGLYSDTLDLTASGVYSCDKPIKVYGESLDSTAVVFDNNNTLGPVVRLNGVMGISFSHMTFKLTASAFHNTIIIENGAACNSFNNCVVEGRFNTSSTSTDFATVLCSSGQEVDNDFYNCVFKYGSYGLYSNGPNYSSGSQVDIIGNTFLDNYFRGLYALNSKYVQVIGNYAVLTEAKHSSYYGMLVSNCKSMLLSHNSVYNPFGGNGAIVFTECDGTSQDTTKVYNNYVFGMTTNYLANIFSGSYSNNVHVSNNTVRCTQGIAAGFSWSSNFRVDNNIFENTAVDGAGLEMLHMGGNVVAERNCFYVPNGDIGEHQNNRYHTLADWQALGYDSTSFVANPLFDDLSVHAHAVLLDKEAIPYTHIFDDFEGDIRNSSTPDIGADEFDPLTADAGMLAMLNPTMPFPAGTNPVYVRFYNNSGDTLHNVTFDWEINGSLQEPFIWDGLLPGGAIYDSLEIGQYEFDAFTSYTVKIWVSNPNGMTDQLSINDTILLENQFAGLSGVYTIGGGEPDFETITEAVDALNAGGADAPVTFNIRNGTYSETILLHDFPGSECDNPVIFQSESSDSALVKISNLGIDEYTIVLDGADGVQFKNLTIESVNSAYRYVVLFSNGSHCNLFSGNNIKGYQSTSTSNTYTVIKSEAGLDTANVFTNNSIFDGSYSFHLVGNTSAFTNTVISENLLEPYYRGIYINDMEGVAIVNNIINVDERTSSRGIEIYDSPNLIQVSGNIVNIPLGQYGVYLSNCDNSETNHSRIFNNFISVGGTSIARGIYASSCAFMDVLHNSILVYSTNSTLTNTNPLYLSSNPSLSVINNALKNAGDGYSIYASSNTDMIADNNAYYTDGSTFGYWNGGAVETTFADWQLASSLDSNSINNDPEFISNTDLHTHLVLLNGIGKSNTGILIDIDGETRDSLPDVGADEFDVLPSDDAGIFMFAGPHVPFAAGNNPVQFVIKNFGGNPLTSANIRWTVNGIEQTEYEWSGNLESSACDTFDIGNYQFDELVSYNIDAWSEMPNDSLDANPDNDLFSTGNFYAALAGTYTVGGFTPDFNLVSELETVLNAGGIVDDVAFEFRPGEYEEALVITDFPKSAYSYGVTFTSETEDSTDVTLTQNANNTVLVDLDNAHGITFSHMTFYNAKGHVFQIRNESSLISISNNHIESSEAIAGSRALIFSSSTTDDSISILNNSLHNGYYGIYLFGGDHEKGHVVTGNTFTGKYRNCVYMRNFKGLVMSNNLFDATSTTNSDVHIYTGSGACTITQNIFFSDDSYHALYFGSISNSTSDSSLVANNYIYKAGESAYDVAIITGVNKIKIDFNSIYSDVEHPSAAALYTNGLTDCSIRNNILYSAEGPAYHNFGTMASVHDYNAIRSFGPVTAIQQYTSYATLADFVNSTGTNTHSFEVDPLFISNQGPEIAQHLLDGAGISVAGMTNDINGTMRTSPPDIGAAEFTPSDFDVKVSHVVSPSFGCGLSDEEVVEIALVNLGSMSATGFDISFDFNNEVTLENLGSLEVPPGDTLFYTFSETIDVSAFDTYALPVWIDFPTDENGDNDSIVHSIDNYPPMNTVPGNLTPSNGTNGLENQVSLSWSPVTGAVAYDLYVWEQPESKPVTPSYGGITTINKLITGLSYGTTYAWQVHATNICGDEVESDTSLFSVRHLPDLVVESIIVPPTAFSEQTIGIEWVTNNMGEGATVPGTWYENIYLSIDPTYNSFDPLLASVSSLASLNPDQSYAHSANVVIPQGSNGLYYIIIKTDHYNAVKETNNNNNTTYSVMQINITLSPPPDLLVTGITVPSVTFSGESINMAFTVSNLGVGVTTDSIWKDELTLVPAPGNSDGVSTSLTLKTHNGILLPDSSYTVNLEVDIPENIFGDYQIRVDADNRFDVFEFASEGNNSLLSDIMEIVLTPPVDLVPDSLETPDTMSLYETYPINFQVKNEGGSAPGTYFTDRYYISQSPVYNPNFLTHLGYAHHNAGLMPEQYDEKTVDVKLTGAYAGIYYIYLVTDYNNRIDEYLFEDNNILRSDPFMVIRPDLVPDSLLHTENVMSGSSIDLETEVVNLGPGAYIGSFVNRYYLSEDTILSTMTDYLLSSRTVSNVSLYTADTVSNTFSFSLPSDQFGAKYLLCHTDASEKAHEVNEDNNVLASPIMIFESPHPDLVTSMLMAPDTITAGVQFPVSYVIKNEGQVALGTSVTDSLFLSFSPTWNRSTATPLGTRGTSQLDTAQSISYSVTLETAIDQNPNEYYLYIVSDATDKVYEGSGEDNNIQRSDLIVLLNYPEVDLSLNNISGLPDTLTSGQSYPVQYEVSNLSDYPTYFSAWTDRYYFSVDSLFDVNNDMLLGSLAYSGGIIDSGESKQVSVVLQLPDGISGDYYLFVEADGENLNDDPARLNNANSPRSLGEARRLHVKLALYPDLVPTNFICPVEIVSGQYFDIITTVTNSGAGPSGLRTDKIFVSTNNVIDNGDLSLISTNKGVLESSGTQTDTFSVFVPANYSGNYYIIYSVDHGNVVYEHTNEQNNVFLSSIVATPPPPADLIVKNILVPDSVLAGETDSIIWQTKNQGSNPATGSFREIVYLSSDTTWQITDEVIGIWDGSVSLAPGAIVTKGMSLPYNNVINANYHTLIRTDARNNIPESDEDNNIGFSFDLTNVDIKELFLDQVEETQLFAGLNRYYKLLVSAEDAGRNILLTLTGDSLFGVNQLYVKYETVPTPADHDYAYSHPFSPHQRIMIRNAEPGFYYIMMNGFKTVDNTPQPVELLARLLQMEILEVSPDQAGNWGYTTIELLGSDLLELESVQLISVDTLEYHAIIADTFLILEDGVRVIARFNLEDQPIGMYHVQCIRVGSWVATLLNGFEIIEGSGPDLQVHWDLNPKIYNPRSTTLFQIKVDVENLGDADAIDRYIRVGSPQFDNPVYYSLSDYYNGIEHTQVVLASEDLNGFPGVLRPGGRRTFYVIGRIGGTQGFSIHYDK